MWAAVILTRGKGNESKRGFEGLRNKPIKTLKPNIFCTLRFIVIAWEIFILIIHTRAFAGCNQFLEFLIILKPFAKLLSLHRLPTFFLWCQSPVSYVPLWAELVPKTCPNPSTCWTVPPCSCGSRRTVQLASSPLKSQFERIDPTHACELHLGKTKRKQFIKFGGCVGS